MATSEDDGSNKKQTDSAGDPDGFDTFDNEIIQSQLDTGLLDCLVSRCIITIQEAEGIREESGPMNRNKQLLSILKDRPYDCYGYFIEALQKSNTIPDGDLVDKMKAFKIKGPQPDVKFTEQSIKVEDFQVRLQKSYQTLVEQMSSPMTVACRLLELDTFNSEDIQYINELSTSSQKNRKILSNIASKQKSGFKSFLEAMKTSGDPQDKELIKDVENMEVTSDDRLLLHIGLSYERRYLSLHVRDLQKIKKDIEDMKMEGISENRKEIIRNTLEKWHKNEEMFIPTKAVEAIYTQIQTRSCVTVTGNSGMGKTMAVRHVALKMLEEGYTVVPIIYPEEIVQLFSTQKKTLFVIDDLCGKYTLNQNYLDRWKLILEAVKSLLDKQFCKIVSTCRLQVYKDIKFKSLSLFKECECNLKSENLSLTPEEIEQFGNKYFGKQHASQAISQFKQYDYFPFLCNLYQKKKRVNFETFCKDPFQFIGEEVDNLSCEGDEGRYKYCVLVLCIIHNNHLAEKYFTGKIDKNTRELIEQVLEECEVSRTTPPKCLHKALETLVGTFLTKDKDCYRMLHDKLFDYVSFHLGRKMIDIMIEHADIALLRERFVWDESNAEDKVDLTINLPDDKVDSYIERIITDWRQKNVIEFSNNRNLKSLKFRDKVNDYLNKLDKSDQEELVSIVDKGESQSTPLISCCYIGNLKLTQWLLQHDADVNQCRSDDVSALHFACHEGYIDIVRELLKRGADINKCDDDGWSPLYTACSNGNVGIVRELLKHKPDINKCDDDGWSPLYTACEEGNVEIVRELLQHKPDINKCNNNDWSPLNIASGKGNVEIVRELLQHKPDINKCNNNDWSPLNIASGKGNVEIVRELLQHKPDINKCNNNGYSPLNTACEKGNVEIVRELLHHKPDINKCNNNGYSPLNTACEKGNVEIVRELLQHKPDINKCDDDGWSPLYTACEEGNVEIVRELLQHKPDINKCNNNDWSPLYTACIKGNVEIVRELLQHKPDINKCNNNGYSPLNTACEKGNVEIVRELLHHKPDINKCNNNGYSPLNTACEKGNVEIVRELLHHKPDINKCNNNGYSPLNTACENGNVEIVRELLQHKPDINKCDDDGWSPLNTACEEGNVEIVRELLQHKPDINNCNNNGYSPLNTACEEGNVEIVRELLLHKPDINKCNNYGDSPLNTACEEGNVEIVRELLLHKPDINKCNNYGDSPLNTACEEGNVEIVRELLLHKPDINKCDDGWSPLNTACEEGNVEIVRELLQHKPDINKCSIHGSSPLHIACEYNHKDIVVELLKYDVMIDLYDNDGDTAIYLACDTGNTKLVKLLLERGVDVNKCSNTGETPLLLSCALGNIDIVDMLLHKNADVNLCIHSKQTYIEEIKGYRDRHYGEDRTLWAKIKNTGSMMTKEYTDGDDWIINKTAGASPLHLACFMGHDEIVNLLLEKSPDINMTTDDGTTPLFLACEIGHENLVSLLLKRGAKPSIHRQDGKSPYSIAMENGHTSLTLLLTS